MMERIWLGVLYLSGWNTCMCLLHQYHYVADDKTWAEAQLYCRAPYKDLATIENAEELNQLINTLSSHGYNSDVWIDLFSAIDWRWSDGSGSEYRIWENRVNNEPYFYYYDQLCVVIGDTGRWLDVRCKWECPFICYRGTQLDTEFVFVSERMSWSSAHRYCRENFIDLATVRNDAENNKIRKFLQGGDYAWIGLFKYHMYWSDGSGLSFSSWFEVYTTGSLTRSCGWRMSGKLRLASCESKLPFVCYSGPVTRQVMKLRMKPEDPSLDLNDHAVKADILKRLQDRLKENGVMGATLKWREHPDGKVFNKEENSSQRKLVKQAELCNRS